MQHPGKELAFADMKPPHFEQGTNCSGTKMYYVMYVYLLNLSLAEPMESHVPSLCNQQESRRILRE